jgi:hypothetical protein
MVINISFSVENYVIVPHWWLAVPLSLEKYVIILWYAHTEDEALQKDGENMNTKYYILLKNS